MQVIFTFHVCLEPAEIASKDFLQKINTCTTQTTSRDKPAPALSFSTHGQSSNAETLD